MPRNSYFKYLYSEDVEVPRRTLSRWKKRARSLERDNNIEEEDFPNDFSVNNLNKSYDATNLIDDNQIDSHEEDFIEDSIEDSIEDLNFSIRELFTGEETFNQTDLYAAFLSLFFSSKLSQSSFSIVVGFVKLISDLQVPKNFDDCGNTFLKLVNDKAIKSSKIWFCLECNKKVELTQSRQRMCNICCTRFVN